MNYINENCPVCGKQFTENDDIAVCPVCGTPHHRQCYLDVKECANHSKHAEGFEWLPSSEPTLPFIRHLDTEGHDEDKVVCPYCGKENNNVEQNCVYCGGQLYSSPYVGDSGIPNVQGTAFVGDRVVQIMPYDIIGGHSVADTADFVQRNADNYIPKFYKMERTGKKLSFNWAAFLFSPYWFFYRKMHVIGFVFIIASLALSLLCNLAPNVQAATKELNAAYEQFLAGNSAITQQQLGQMAMNLYMMPEMLITSAANLLLHIAAGLFGNYFYKEKVRKDINAIKQSSPSGEIYRVMLFKRGGVSLAMVILSMCGLYCAEQIIGMILTGGGI